MRGWMILETGLHPTVLRRMPGNLQAAGIQYRIEGDAILVPDNDDMRRAVGLMDLLLDCHARILHHADPAKAKPYKPLERDVIVAVVVGLLQRHPDATGNGFLAELLHALVWAQGLPNTNHRSTLLLVNRLAGADAATVRNAMDAFIRASKPLIQEREFAPDPKPLQRAHLDAARSYVASLPSGR